MANAMQTELNAAYEAIKNPKPRPADKIVKPDKSPGKREESDPVSDGFAYDRADHVTTEGIRRRPVRDATVIKASWKRRLNLRITGALMLLAGSAMYYLALKEGYDHYGDAQPTSDSAGITPMKWIGAIVAVIGVCRIAASVWGAQESIRPSPHDDRQEPDSKEESVVQASMPSPSPSDQQIISRGLECIKNGRTASTPSLQEALYISYNRAAYIIDYLEQSGVPQRLER